MTDTNRATQKSRKTKAGAAGEKLRAIRKKKEEVKNKLKGVLAKKPLNTVTHNKLEVLVTIVERSKAEYYLDVLQAFEVNMQCVTLGHGTADAKTVGLLGLSPEKAVIFSVIQQNKISDALQTLEEKFRTIKNGKGIAYSLPMSSVIGTLIYGFLSNNRMAIKENK